jgi:hypothetical protein
MYLIGWYSNLAWNNVNLDALIYKYVLLQRTQYLLLAKSADDWAGRQIEKCSYSSNNDWIYVYCVTSLYLKQNKYLCCDCTEY